MKTSLMTDIFNVIKSFTFGIFSIIPQFAYFLYASMASLLDLFQFMIRKIVGLDTYYIKVGTNEYVEKSGDILSEFIEGMLGINKNYSSLATVFWSMVIFGLIILVLTTIFAIIKAHYNYDSKKSHPLMFIKNTVKSIFTMAITPLLVVFGLVIGQIMFNGFDKIVTTNPNSSIGGVFNSNTLDRFESGYKVDEKSNKDGDALITETDKTYTNYDMFLVKEWSNTTTFSGMIFEIMTFNANRVRRGQYTATTSATGAEWDNLELFYSDEAENKQENVANQIDFAFMNALSLKDKTGLNIYYGEESTEQMGFTLFFAGSAAFYAQTFHFGGFSKFNVGQVWYYYDLWCANFLLGYAGAITILILLSNIVFGLFKRLFICISLFFVYAPVLAISPLDEGDAFNTWKKEFLKYAISGYSTITGMNLFFMFIPLIKQISFFEIVFLNKIFSVILILVGLVLVRNFIALVCKFVGAADLNSEGADVKKDVGNLAVKAANATIQTGSLGLSVGKSVAGKSIPNFVSRKIRNIIPPKPSGGNGGSGGSGGVANQTPEGTPPPQTPPKQSAGKVKKERKPMGKMATHIVAGTLGIMGVMDSQAITPYKDEIEVEDEDGNVSIVRGEEAIQLQKQERKENIKKAFLDMNGVILKAVGEVTGVKNATSKLNNNGLMDDLKGFAQEGLSMTKFGGESISEAKQGRGNLATKKQKEKASKDADNAIRENVGKMATDSTDALSAMREINRKIR